MATLVGVVCVYFLVRLFAFPQIRTVRNDIVQGILIGAGLAFVSAQIYARVKAKKFNGWITMFGLGEPSNGRWTNTDGAGHALSGVHNYVMHFPAGGLPPNNAFWSITMGDAGNHFVANPINRYSVSDRSGLAQNADGSVDIYIQNTAPAGHESNWLPAPTGKFILWLRVYIPGQTILDGQYKVPPVVEVK